MTFSCSRRGKKASEARWPLSALEVCCWLDHTDYHRSISLDGCLRKYFHNTFHSVAITMSEAEWLTTHCVKDTLRLTLGARNLNQIISSFQSKSWIPSLDAWRFLTSAVGIATTYLRVPRYFITWMSIPDLKVCVQGFNTASRGSGIFKLSYQIWLKMSDLRLFSLLLCGHFKIIKGCLRFHAHVMLSMLC